MATVFYKSHDPAEIGPLVEEVLRADLGSPAPLPYAILGRGPDESKAKSFLADVGKLAFGGRADALFEVEFELSGERGAYADVAVLSKGIRACCGPVRFSVFIRRPLAAPVALERGRKPLRAPKFVDGPVAERLNAIPDLAKRADRILQESMVVGPSQLLHAEPIFRLVPVTGGAGLMVSTLPYVKPGWIKGMKVSTNAAEILALAEAIEAAL